MALHYAIRRYVLIPKCVAAQECVVLPEGGGSYGQSHDDNF